MSRPFSGGSLVNPEVNKDIYIDNIHHICLWKILEIKDQSDTIQSSIFVTRKLGILLYKFWENVA